MGSTSKTAGMAWGNKSSSPVAKKTSNRSKSNSSIESVSIQNQDNTYMSVRKIENGFIVRKSGSTGEGRNRKYFEQETFSPTNPVEVKIPKGKFNLSGKK